MPTLHPHISTARMLLNLLNFKEVVVDSVDAADMFKVQNMKHLIKAIEDLTERDGETKHGLKIQIQNLVKEAVKTIQAHYLVQSRSKESDVVAEFMKVFSVVEHEIFNGALYKIRQQRNKTTRKPANLPDENDVNLLNFYITEVTCIYIYIYWSFVKSGKYFENKPPL